jgi:hypothetical protein
VRPQGLRREADPQTRVPDLEVVRDSYTHDLQKLLKLSGLTEAFSKRSLRADRFGRHWRDVTKWKESSRYDRVDKAMAEDMVRAVGDTKEGILAWIRHHW